MKLIDKIASWGIVRGSFNTSSWTGLLQTFALRKSHVSELHMNQAPNSCRNLEIACGGRVGNRKKTLCYKVKCTWLGRCELNNTDWLSASPAEIRNNSQIGM